MKEFRKKCSAIVVIVFLVFMLLYTTFREKGKISFQENRILSQFPKIKISEILNGEYTFSLHEYFTDQIAGRSKWMKIYADISKDNGEGKVNGVYVSDDMLLDCTADTSDISIDVAEKVNKFAEKYHSSFYFIAVPSSDGIYSNNLPKYIEPDYQMRQTENFYSELNTEIRKINAFNILKNFSDDYVYYRTDTKWTPYGAYCVYRTAIQKLGFIPIAYDKYTIEHTTADFKGNLYNRSQCEISKSDFLDLYYSESINIDNITAYDENLNEKTVNLYEKKFLESSNMYNVYLGEDCPVLKIKTAVNNNKKIMIIKDEYADCFIPFLAQHYSEILAISVNYSDFDFETHFRVGEYEQVMFICGIENLVKDNALDIIG